jgi:hypothetical protein
MPVVVPDHMRQKLLGQEKWGQQVSPQCDANVVVCAVGYSPAS